MARTVHRLTAKVAGRVAGIPIAADVFEPNVVRTAMAGPFGLVAAVLNWRRQDKAILGGDGLAPTTLLVVTRDTVYAFDAGLLRWNAVRELAAWPRADVVARAVPLPGPHPAGWSMTRGRPHPGLCLENRAGQRLAEIRPVFWRSEAKAVFAELTGFPGWPHGRQPPADG